LWHVVSFFSSRRRHTRFSRDWSSDVCSSDLGTPPSDPTIIAANIAVNNAIDIEFYKRFAMKPADAEAIFDHQYFECVGHNYQMRSEERRVGKECRSRWLLDPYDAQRGHGAKR